MWPFAVFLPHIASFGCSEPTTYEPYDVRVSSVSQRVATGGTAFVQVSVDSHDRDEDFDGWCGPYPHDVEVTIDRVDCKPDCTATHGADGVNVTSSSPGDKTVEIDTRTSDGKAQTQSVTVTFANVTRILVERDVASSPSGTKRAMVLGDTQRWLVVAGDEDGPIESTACAGFGVSSNGAALSATSSTEAPGANVEIKANQVGVATVELRCGSLTRSAQVTVVDPARAKSVALLEAGKSAVLDVDTETELFAAPSPLVLRFLCEDALKAFVPELVMDDGTVAFGGASLLQASTPDAVAIVADGQIATAQVLVPSDGAILGAYGAAKLDAPYIVRTGCPEVDEDVDGGAPNEADAGDQADAGADASADGGGR
jgi:hypothetical protein